VIKPALTPVEWAYGTVEQVSRATYDHVRGGEADHVGQLVFTDYPGTGPIYNPHGVAALCLHEQPFGFRREDVATLRANCAGFKMVADAAGAPGSVGAEIAKLLDIADRIEALLPPETSSDG
jgi:hypothetical protein